jgi:hypothetical protein
MSNSTDTNHRTVVTPLKPALRSKTQFLNRYVAFKVVQTTTPVVHTLTLTNIFDHLDDEGNSSPDDQEGEEVEVERGIRQREFSNSITKRDRNKIVHQIRKVAI